MAEFVYYPEEKSEDQPLWGLDTGVDGKHFSRLVLLKELHNYGRIIHNGFIFYLSIVDTKHPMLYKRVYESHEVWRMRFNVFSTGFFTEWTSNSLLHLGEIHVYYDLISSCPKPWYNGFNVYFDPREIEAQIDVPLYAKMCQSFKDSLIKKRLTRHLSLPISKSEFSFWNDVLDHFIERQELMLSRLSEIRGEYKILPKSSVFTRLGTKKSPQKKGSVFERLGYALCLDRFQWNPKVIMNEGSVGADTNKRPVHSRKQMKKLGLRKTVFERLGTI